MRARILSPFSVLLAAGLAAAAQQTRPLSAPPADLELPPEKQFPPIGIVVEPGRYRVVETGEVVTKDGASGRPLSATSAIAAAVRYHAKPGLSIGVKGVDVHGFGLGALGGSVHGTKNGFWREGEGRHGSKGKGGYAPVDQLYFVGLDPDRGAVISGVGGFGRQYGGFKTVGFKNITFRFELPGAGKAPLHFDKSQVGGGRLYLYDCDVRAYKGREAPWFRRDHPLYQEGRQPDWHGFGKLWGMRMMEITCDFRRLNIDSGKEHGMYMSAVSPGRQPSYFVDIVTWGNGRTGMQFVNRRGNTRPSRGGYLIQDCVVRGGGTGDGGSDFTFVGGGGTIVLRNLTSLDPHHGSLAMWIDPWTPDGTWTYGGEQRGLEGADWDAATHGYGFERVIVDGFRVARSDGGPVRGNRPHATIIGARQVVVRSFDVHGTNIVWNGLAPGTFAAGGRFGGPIPNGEVVWDIEGPLSQYPGWHGSSKKIGRQVPGRDPDFLTDAEVDALGSN